MIEAETKVKAWDINDPHAMRIHRLVGKMIATPFSVVDLIVSLKLLNPGIHYQVKNISQIVLYQISKTKSMKT